MSAIVARLPLPVTVNVSVTTLPASSGDGLYVALNEVALLSVPAPLCVHKIVPFVNVGIVHRVWRCLARLHRHPQNRGRFGDGQDRVSTTLPQLPLPVMVNVRDDIGIGIRGNRVVRYAQCV